MQSKAMQDIAKQSNANQCSTRLVLGVSVDKRTTQLGSRRVNVSLFVPQTVLALRGSGGIKGGLVKGSDHQAPHWTPRDTKNVQKTMIV